MEIIHTGNRETLNIGYQMSLIDIGKQLNLQTVDTPAKALPLILAMLAKVTTLLSKPYKAQTARISGFKLTGLYVAQLVRIDALHNFGHIEVLEYLASIINDYVAEYEYVSRPPRFVVPPITELSRSYLQINDQYRKADQYEIPVQVDVSEQDFCNVPKSPVSSIGIKPFIVKRAPVIPIVSGLTADRAINQRLRASEVAGYVILENQIVIGINNQNVTKRNTAMAEAERVADIIYQAKKVNLTLVSDHAVGGGNATWFWYARSRTINALMRASGNQFAVSEWGFAS